MVSDTPSTESSGNPYESPRSTARRRPIPRDVRVIGASFAVQTVLGCVLIIGYWWFADAIISGIVRCVGFAAMMAGLHFVGYRLWKRQKASSATKASSSRQPTSMWEQNVPFGLLWLIVIALLLFVLSFLLL